MSTRNKRDEELAEVGLGSLVPPITYIVALRRPELTKYTVRYKARRNTPSLGPLSSTIKYYRGISLLYTVHTRTHTRTARMKSSRGIRSVVDRML
jgi:hypothetical protein